LQELTLKIAPDSRCEYIGDPQKELCVVAAGDKHAMACRGDSGSPFVRNILQQPVLMGVVEGDGDNIIFHPNECDENFNGDQGAATMVDVSKYTPWVIGTIFNNVAGNASQKAAQMPVLLKQ
jgi:secreted trypsin-like serine protease